MPATHAPETLNQVLFVSFVPRFPLVSEWRLSTTFPLNTVFKHVQ